MGLPRASGAKGAPLAFTKGIADTTLQSRRPHRRQQARDSIGRDSWKVKGT